MRLREFTPPPSPPPLTAAEFTALIAPLTPATRVAVAVSGGADSMALCWLAHMWAQALGGAVLALTVDHGLRADSAAEAELVGRRLTALGIEHRALRWTEAKPATGIQEAARAARYRLLIGCCLEHGVSDLLLGHHRQDQAETLLLRLSRGSGVDGLAGMAAARRFGPLRLLRPLLTVDKARLAASCRAAGLAWVEDPSNHSPAFARARFRAAAGALAELGLTDAALCAVAGSARETLAALHAAVDDLLARAATETDYGWLLVNPGPLITASEGLGRRALARCLATIGGGGYPIRRERLQRLWRELASGLTAGRTLAGCRIMPRRDGLLIAREPAAITERSPLACGRPVWWDQRFVISVKADRLDNGLTVAQLGEHGRHALRSVGFESPLAAVPAMVQPSLPAIWTEQGLVAAPHLGYRHPDWLGRAQAWAAPAAALFATSAPRPEVAGVFEVV